MTQPLIWNALRRRYKGNEWALFAETSNATGYGGCGNADVLALNLWPSRGLVLLGFEVKVSRGDWLRELKSPEKAERFAQYCDEWWVVTTSDVIKEESEVPATWGWLLLPRTNRVVSKNLKEMRAATRKEEQPVLPREFMAAILRRASEMAENSEMIRAASAQAYDDGFAEGRKQQKKSKLQDEIRRLEAELRYKQLTIDEYEAAVKAAGMDFNAWDYKQVAQYVRVLQSLHPNRLMMSFHSALKEIEGIRERLAGALSHLEEDTKELQEKLRR